MAETGVEVGNWEGRKAEVLHMGNVNRTKLSQHFVSKAARLAYSLLGGDGSSGS